MMTMMKWKRFSYRAVEKGRLFRQKENAFPSAAGQKMWRGKKKRTLASMPVAGKVTCVVEERESEHSLDENINLHAGVHNNTEVQVKRLIFRIYRPSLLFLLVRSLLVLRFTTWCMEWTTTGHLWIMHEQFF